MNRSRLSPFFFGLALAAGKASEEAQREIGQVVEGVLAARAVTHVARNFHVVMPIAEQIRLLLHEDKPARQVVGDLMSRQARPEFWS